MSNIEFLSLGGIDEKGKNCYVLTIDNEIFVIDCGIYYPANQILGFESAIPDFEYLKARKDQVKGIFIGTPYEKNYGSIKHLSDEIKAPIYTTNINAEIINVNLEDAIQFNTIESLKTFTVGNIKVTPFKITNSLPNSVGFVFQTNSENIIYIDECVISSSKMPILTNDVLKIIPHISTNTNILLTSVGKVSTNAAFTSPSFQTQNYFNDLCNENDDKLVIALYSFEIYKIVSLLNACALSNKTVAFFNPKTVKILNKMSEFGLINISKFKIVPLSEVKDAKQNVVIIIDEHAHNFFETLNDICEEQYPDLTLDEKTTYLFASQTINGLERKQAGLFDVINKCNVKRATQIPNKYIDLSPGAEDLKFLAALFRPKYIIPIKSLYMDFVNYQNTLVKTGFPKNNVIILRNGQKLTITNGIANEKTEFIELAQRLINTKGYIDEIDNSTFERNQMKDNGVVVVSYIINTQEKKLKKAKYDDVGIIGRTPQNETIINTIANKVNEEVGKILETMLENKDKLDTKEFKINTRKIIIKQFEKNFDKKPLVMMTIIFE
ncbi:MAG: ribonuclease J [Mycoplasmataceae bacterium]|jgi:ribonuclease J|nr:ribonuclease J [Mycoplasmataceae bacterium]